MSGESTVRDALIAETLGDIGKLHDRVNALNVTLEKQTKAFEDQTLKFIDLLQNPSSGHLNPSAKGASLDEIKEVVDGFKAHLISAIGKGNERILATFGTNDPAKSLVAQGGAKIESELEMFKTVTEQWSADAGAIGQTMNDLLTRSDKTLEQIALLQERTNAKAVNIGGIQASNIVKPAEKKTTPKSVIPTILATAVATSALFLVFYYTTGIAKYAELGSNLTREWQKFDVPTKKKINDVLNAK